MHLLKPMHIAMVRITMFDVFIESIVQFFATQLTATELLVVIKHVMQCNHLCAGGEHAERTMKYQSVLDVSTSERIGWVQIMLHPNVPIHCLHCGQNDTTRLTLIVLIASCCQSQQYVQFAVSKILKIIGQMCFRCHMPAQIRCRVVRLVTVGALLQMPQITSHKILNAMRLG